MTKDDAYDMLRWLEAVFPDRIQFPDKMALAEGYMAARESMK